IWCTTHRPPFVVVTQRNPSERVSAPARLRRATDIPDAPRGSKPLKKDRFAALETFEQMITHRSVRYATP
ncbi:hypothetical protein ABT298_37710, partial [Streptomyces sp. NPDC001034]|uniref:hypothetical protein n=1 Tax=Streptomyces sp. NPDC001034 TaxID=3154375 RepID=UPI003318D6BF